MNTKLIHEVADTIERLEFGYEKGQFGMSDFIHSPTEEDPYSCHSPACIAGWTCFLADGIVLSDVNPMTDRMTAYERAAELLGLDFEMAGKLFAPIRENAHFEALPGRQGYISPERAAATLRRLADTGVVDWGQPDE